MTKKRLFLLAGALEVEGALPSLRILNVDYALSPGDFSILTRVLAGGAAPSLECFYFNERGFNENDTSSLADMVEARSRIPGCKGLEHIEGNGENWFDKPSIATRLRLLRALLPSATHLPDFTWRYDFKVCFCEVQAPHLTLFKIMLDENEDDGAVFSWNVLEAAPAVTEIMIASDVNIPNNPHGGTVLQSISAVLRHGAMRNLEGFGLWTPWRNLAARSGWVL